MENNNRQGCRWTEAIDEIKKRSERIKSNQWYPAYGLNSQAKALDETIVYLESLSPIEPCATSSEKDDVLLSFCHFLGRSGYKINGYDDSQLLTVIQQFRTQTPSPTGDRDLLPFEEGYVRKDGTGDRDCEELKKEVERLKGLLEKNIKDDWYDFEPSFIQDMWEIYKSENNL